MFIVPVTNNTWKNTTFLLSIKFKKTGIYSSRKNLYFNTSVNLSKFIVDCQLIVNEAIVDGSIVDEAIVDEAMLIVDCYSLEYVGCTRWSSAKNMFLCLKPSTLTSLNQFFNILLL